VSINPPAPAYLLAITVCLAAAVVVVACSPARSRLTSHQAACRGASMLLLRSLASCVAHPVAGAVRTTGARVVRGSARAPRLWLRCYSSSSSIAIEDDAELERALRDGSGSLPLEPIVKIYADCASPSTKRARLQAARHIDLALTTSTSDVMQTTSCRYQCARSCSCPCP